MYSSQLNQNLSSENYYAKSPSGLYFFCINKNDEQVKNNTFLEHIYDKNEKNRIKRHFLKETIIGHHR